MSNTFYGKYRGIVTDNKDPLMIGRICAKVPDVLGDQESGWAMPCAPFGGKAMGFFALPVTDAGVWIEFEHGDPDYPIWSGCWWGSSAEMPPVLLSEPYKKVMLKTESGHSILLDDTSGSGGITLETSGGQKIVMDSNGIEITKGQVIKIEASGGQKIVIDSNGIQITNGQEIKLETSGGQKMVISSSGIEITNGQGASIKMSGSQVTINNGALEVT